MLTGIAKKGGLRRMYEVAALVALLNAVAVVGLVVYIGISDLISLDQVRRAVAVLRGSVTSSAPEKNSAEPGKLTIESSSSPVRDLNPISDVDLEIIRREAERIKVELDQRMALSNAVLLKVRTEREEFQKEREQAVKQQESSAEVKRDENIQRQVQIFEALAPKIAMQHLLAMADPNEAAGILVALEPEKSKKIIESAKRGNELAQMKAVLQRVPDVSPIAKKLASAGPGEGD